MQQLLGVLIVVIHHILAVPLGGGRARAFVENRFDIAELFASHNLDQEVFLIHIVCDIQIHQVHKLGAVFQVVHHQNIGDAFIIQALTMLLPIKPAPPVTMIITVTFELWSQRQSQTRMSVIIPSHPNPFSPLHRGARMLIATN